MPVFVVALLIGVFLFSKSSRERSTILLFTLNLLFCALVLINLILWSNSNLQVLAFAWPLSQFIYVAIPVVSLYLFYSFLNKESIQLRYKFVWAVMILVGVVLAFSPYNILYVDATMCEVVTSSIFDIYQNIIFGVIFLWLIVAGVIRVRASKVRNERAQILLFLGGLLIFISTLVFTWQIAAELGLFEVEQYGLFGMLIFMSILAYMVVRYRIFNTSLLASQALVFALIILIGSQFTFVDSITNRILVAVTLSLTGAIGIVLIRSVKREIEQRERIEKLALELEKSNRQQVTLIHFITHQIKGFVTKSRNIFSSLLDGDYGQMPETARPLVEEGLRSDTKGALTIQEILNAANIKNGKVTYAREPFDLKAVTDEIVAELKPAAVAKGLALTVATSEEVLTIPGDRMQILNALKNLIDNSIKYTPSGSVAITFEKEPQTVRMTVQDTGVGITAEDMQHLFTEGGHGKESQKINVDSTGFGLYIVKNIIEAHKGKVWAESEGAGKGARFVVELPVS